MYNNTVFNILLRNSNNFYETSYEQRSGTQRMKRKKSQYNQNPYLTTCSYASVFISTFFLHPTRQTQKLFDAIGFCPAHLFPSLPPIGLIAAPEFTVHPSSPSPDFFLQQPLQTPIAEVPDGRSLAPGTPHLINQYASTVYLSRKCMHNLWQIYTALHSKEMGSLKCEAQVCHRERNRGQR